MWLLSFIKFSHLAALGVTEGQMYIILIALGILFCYIIVFPFIEWLVTLRSIRLITYIISSQIVLAIFFILLIFSKSLTNQIIPLLELTLKVIGLFGGGLFVFYSLRYMIKKI